LRAGPESLPAGRVRPLLPHAEALYRSALARGDGRYSKLLRTIARTKLLILDEWGPETLTPEQARDLLEIVEDRYDVGSVMITSQIPVDRWHDMIGVPTLADAILDRVIHNAYRIDLSGDSLRKQRSSS
jgi:DNA replication protein DnaC